MVLVDAWAPGWSVAVDGKPAPIERVDALLRGVFVTAGEHRIAFRYQTPGLRLGAAVSVLSFMLLALLWVRWSRAPAVESGSASSHDSSQ